jgi:CPA1 family monovalent cation:H+ antiporter
MGFIISRTIALLVVASLVAIAARRLRLPYTVGLVLAGIGLSLSGLGAGAPLTHDLIFLVILPPLLFEAALGLPWREFRRDALPVITLSTLGVVVAAIVVAAGMVRLLGWPLHPALIFGVLIAATDPVAVIAMFKSIKVSRRIQLMVETESLLNDGVAAVLFGMVLAWDETSAPTIFAVGRDLAVTVGGGVLIGLACAVAALALAGRTGDHLVETVLTAAAAYGSFLLAEHLRVSGVLATVTAGSVMGSVRLPWLDRVGILSSCIISPLGREFLKPFWEFAAFVANSLIFLLIGLAAPAETLVTSRFYALTVTIGLVLAARAVSVYGTGFAFCRTRWVVPPAAQHILWWGGLRGALGLALALSLPRELANHDEITLMTFGVVVFSIVLQGLSMPTLLTRLGDGADDGPHVH